MNESFTLAVQEIDSALRSVGGVHPRDGFEQRLLASFASEYRTLASRKQPRRIWSLARLSTPAKAGGLLLAAGIAAAAVLVGGAIHKSPASIPASPLIAAPAQQRPVSGGFGPASGGRIPGQALKVEHGSSKGRGTRRPRQGRTVLPSSPLHRADGSATPDSPYPR